MSYEDYVEKKLFEPLGMTRSSYCNITENVTHRAHGYMLSAARPCARRPTCTPGPSRRARSARPRPT
jgi:CubicO group peptidase (beta-lactamase class C family)